MSYTNRKLNSIEQQYPTEDTEFLAIVFTTVKLRHYLSGGPKRAVCLTDHESLKYLYSKRDLKKRYSRRIKKIVDVNYVILWVPGKEQIVPNELSCRLDYGKCSSLVVKPNFLGNVSLCTFDPDDVEMAAVIESAKLVDSDL